MSELTLIKNPPALPLDNSRPGTHNIWIENAERNAEVARKEGFSKSTNAWVRCDRLEIRLVLIIFTSDLCEGRRHPFKRYCVGLR